MSVSKKIHTMMTTSSWIRRMFEEGAKLKSIHGAANVFDFSLGNPNLQPPPEFKKILKETALNDQAGTHAYMPNVGYPEVRQSIANYLKKEQGEDISGDQIVMTCGAAGALNVIFKTLLDPMDEVLVPAPYFVEYGSYADNHGGVLKTVKTNADFTLNLDWMASAITAKTKIVLINSPNNPTGQIYSKESLIDLGKLLEQKSRSFGRAIYLVSDEPYRKIIYDDAVVPGIFNCYQNAIVATSYSKDISIPGERIGFAAVHPGASAAADIMNGMALANRILGFVNAPAMMQKVIASVQGLRVDMSLYEKNRNLLYEALVSYGYEITKPMGAFYLFPRTPIEDDVKFVNALQEELILTVPGSGFGGPGHFRIAYCVETDTIERSLPGFKRVIEKFK